MDRAEGHVAAAGGGGWEGNRRRTDTRGGSDSGVLGWLKSRHKSAAVSDSSQKPGRARSEALYHLVLIRDFKYLYRRRNDGPSRDRAPIFSTDVRPLAVIYARAAF